jgi:outer membrane receptor protein involved in Fe transport
MKTQTLTLSTLLMATTALASPLWAQEATSLPPTDTPVTEAPVETPAAEAPVKEIIVRGKNLPKTMRRTAEVTAILTSEDLKRTGDDTAAAALTRVTGLSLVEGKYVYVRGLGERYSSALLNGSPLPSPEPLQRVVPLDLFPAALLSRVSVQKTYSAEYPGEFGGGVIDLQTAAIPQSSFFNMGIGTGFNTETTGKGAVVHYGSDTDFLGYDNGTRSLPNELRDALKAGKLINTANYPSTGAGATNTLQKIGRDFENANLNLLQKGKADPSFSFNASGGRAFNVLGGKLGLVSVADFSNSWQLRNGTSYGDPYQRSSNNVALNGLLSLGYTRGDHTVKWTNLFVRKTTKLTSTSAGFDSAQLTDIRVDKTGWFQRQLGMTQLTGDHIITPKLKVDWNLSYAITVRDTPYDKFIKYYKDNNVGPTNGLYYTDIVNSNNNGTAFSNLKDTAKNFGINLTYDYSLGQGRDGKLMFGYSVFDNQRDYQYRRFEFKASADSLAKYERPDFLFADFNMRSDLLQINEVSSQSQGYDSGLFVNAYYLKTDLAVLPLVRVAAGVRFEGAKQRNDLRNLYQTNAVLERAKTVIKEDYVLPSGTLTWNFKDDMQLRLGASKTIGRPQFRELAEPNFRDPDSDRTFIGNPFVRDTELTNLDARYEWYYAAGEYVTAGLFYKSLDKPVETISTGNLLQQTFVNVPKATISGFELDYKGLFDSPWKGAFFDTKNWLVQANYTYTDSSVKVKPGDKISFIRTDYQPRDACAAGACYVKDGSKLQGQSDHIANLQFGWKDEEAKSQATLLITYVSERISVRGSGITGDPDIMQEPGTQLDFIYRKGFTTFGRDVNLQVETRNLLGTEYKEYQEVAGGRRYVDTYKVGTNVSFSLSTSF